MKITHDYLCELHGRFEAVVDSADAPDVMPCPVDEECYSCCGQPSAPGGPGSSCACGGKAAPCSFPSPWSPSSAPAVHTQFVVSATQGKSAAKPHATALDTRPLGEGQKFHDWKRDRKKIWEEKRKQRVMELLK